MARFALGAKWGIFGAIGFVVAGADAAKSLPSKSEANATAPMPVAPRPKNWRRVMSCKRSRSNSRKKEFIHYGISVNYSCLSHFGGPSLKYSPGARGTDGEGIKTVGRFVSAAHPAKAGC